MDRARQNSEPGLQDYVAIVQRRLRTLVIVSIAILTVGMLLAAFLPAIYRSEAVILIEQQEIPNELVRSTVTSYADQRIQVISQRVMTSGNLSEIIEKYGLYTRESETEPREVIIEKMREDITREMISADVVDPRSGRPTEATIAFRLAFDSKSPQLAQRVANELVSLYLNENIKRRTESAAETVSFLDEEARRLGRAVGELESNLAKFKSENVENLPELGELTRVQMNRIDLEIAELDRRAEVAEQQRIYIHGELAQIEPYRRKDLFRGESSVEQLDRAEAALSAAEASYSETHPDVVRLRKQVAGLREEVDPAAALKIYERQLSEARGVLGRLIEQYGNEHPDVGIARRAVENLENRIASLPESTEEKPNNPAYIVMSARLESVENEIRSLIEKRESLNELYQIAYKNLAKMPAAEAEYLAINRQYENTVAKYREVAAKQMEARLSSNLEAERKGERFTLIEPPLMPEQPTSPNRLALALISFVLALVGGLGAVGLVEAMDNQVHGRRGLQDLLGVPPLATIPYVPIAGERAATSSLVKFALGGVILVLLTMGTIHFAYKPLDVLWFIALRKFGL